MVSLHGAAKANGDTQEHENQHEINSQHKKRSSRKRRFARSTQFFSGLLGDHHGLLGKVANGWAVSGVTVVQDGTPLTVTDSRGGSIFGFGPGTAVVSRAEYCPGMGAANAASAGSDGQRLGGLSGGQG